MKIAVLYKTNIVDNLQGNYIKNMLEKRLKNSVIDFNYQTTQTFIKATSLNRYQLFEIPEFLNVLGFQCEIIDKKNSF
ncbi:hypothetical protein J2X31_001230 [Flavobacterium arsenatis]|uniref:Uncharacterized protein n=1 Tax=Flavobacterium arsenatis TaxID=1484332 RepID=A0ABU1TP44_9FLAO|nr:hypothetical protein [Flavobacterium arsenatis]MDR6967223.1 hypothetical protein [Flavobacterium arsenatis]